MQDDKLLPCPNPWCENPQGSGVAHHKRDGWRVVSCCGVATPRFKTQGEAVAAWNSRAVQPPPAAQDDKLLPTQADADAADKLIDALIGSGVDMEAGWEVERQVQDAFAAHRLSPADTQVECLPLAEVLADADRLAEAVDAGRRTDASSIVDTLRRLAKHARHRLAHQPAPTQPRPNAGEVDLRKAVIAAMNPHGWLGEQCVTDILAALAPPIAVAPPRAEDAAA